jgi:hypothetical protein
VRLAVREHGQPAVEIYGDPRDVTLTLGESARIELRSGPVLVAGFVEPRSLEVHATAPLNVGPAFVLTGARDLAADLRTWPKDNADHGALRIDAPFGLELLPQTADLPCSQLSLLRADFDATSVLGKGPVRPAMLKVGRRVGLRERAKGAVTGWVTLAAEGEPVVIVGEQGGFSHVAFVRAGLLVHGWVTADDLVESQAALRPQVVVATNADRFDAPLTKEERVCPHEVALDVLEPAARAPHPLGTIPAGTKIGIVLWDKALTQVFVRDAGIFATEGNALVVSTKAFDGCKIP